MTLSRRVTTSQRLNAAASNNPYFELTGILGVPGQKPYSLAIRSVGVVLASAVETTLQLTRGESGEGASLPFSDSWVPMDPHRAIQAEWLLRTGWTTNPVPATTPVRQVVLPAQVGASVLWTFDKEAPLIITTFGFSPNEYESLLLWNSGAAAGAELDVFVEWETVDY